MRPERSTLPSPIMNRGEGLRPGGIIWFHWPETTPNSATRKRSPLDCQGVNGASGTAELAIKDALITGELVAKMGGKNMTFSQHINAKRIGNCFAQ